MQAPSRQPSTEINMPPASINLPEETRPPEAAAAKLSATNLVFHYGAFKALHGISMQVYANRVTAFIGPSGCGKSTFLRTLNRMNETVRHSRVEGEILLDGENIFNLDVSEVRRRVGMVFQKSNPFPKSIFENVAYGPRINGYASRAALRDRVEQSLRRAAIWDEVKDKLQPVRLFALRRPAAAAVHRARAGRESGSAAARRALFRARPDRHREDRGPDLPAQK